MEKNRVIVESITRGVVKLPSSTVIAGVLKTSPQSGKPPPPPPMKKQGK